MSAQEYMTLSPGIVASFANLKDGDDGSEDGNNDPSVILVCGWMGAKLAHLQKYTKVYRERYPHANIFLIRSFHGDFIWSTEHSIITKFLPLIAYLEQMGCVALRGEQPSTLSHIELPVQIQASSRKPRILVHTFSNGGSFSLVTLSRVIAKMGGIPTLRISAMVIDSSPGASYATTVRAFAGFIKNPILRALAAVYISLFYLSLYVRGTLLRTRSPIQHISDLLIRADALPWTGEHTPRLYIFSKTDDLVPWKQVEETVKSSQKAGLDTRIELFDESPHVAHARTDPARYWAAVRQTWESASSANLKN